MVLLGRRFDRTDVEHLFACRVADAADDQRDDAKDDQQDTDELHFHLQVQRCRTMDVLDARSAPDEVRAARSQSAATPRPANRSQLVDAPADTSTKRWRDHL